MAKQISPIFKFQGKIDQINFYKSKDGYMAQMAPEFNKDNYLTSDNYQITRRNASEFGIAGKASRLFRKAFNKEVRKAADYRVTSRVTTAMIKALRTDTTSRFGERRVEKGTLDDLRNFEFNGKLPFRACVMQTPFASVDRVSGTVTVNFPAITPSLHIKGPEGATHFNLFVAASSIDFAQDKEITSSGETGNLVMGGTSVTVPPIELSIDPNSTQPIFIVVGIEFRLLINGESIPFTDNASALHVLAINETP